MRCIANARLDSAEKAGGSDPDAAKMKGKSGNAGSGCGGKYQKMKIIREEQECCTKKSRLRQYRLDH